MTDSVRCSSDASNTFTCEVNIDSDFTPSSPATPSASPSAEAAPRNPAVSMLVHAYRTAPIPRVDVPLVTVDSLKTCVSAELALPLAFATSGYLGPLAGFKAGFDAGQCLASERESASMAATEKRGIDICEAEGGTVTGIMNHAIICSGAAVTP